MKRITVLPVIRHLLYYSRRVFQQGVLYIVLVLDLVGLAIIYYTEFDIPSWLLSVAPVIAIFIAGFVVYREGTADLKLLFSENSGQSCTYIGGIDGVQELYTFSLNGYFTNFGPQGTAIQSVKTETYVNGLNDKFVLNRVGVNVKISEPHDGIIAPEQHGYLSVAAKQTNFPMVMESGDLLPATFFVELTIGSPIGTSTAETVKWIQDVEVRVKISYFQRARSRHENSKASLNVSSLKNSFAMRQHQLKLESEKRNFSA